MFFSSPDATGTRTLPEIAKTGANAACIVTDPRYPAEKLNEISATLLLIA
jgi:mannan endo-1,4-beta-mannosidase